MANRVISLNGDLSVHGQSGQSKVERYDWDITDSPGEFMMIAKDELEIDKRYQREAEQAKARKIASLWSWVACGVLSVALRKSSFFVMDGGHRVMAARYRSDIKQLPCVVFELAELSDEAKGFLNTNTCRKPMSAIDKFKALVLTGDQHAIAVTNLVNSADGYEIAKKPNSAGKVIRCVGMMMALHHKDARVLKDIWPSVIRIFDGEVVTEPILGGIWYAERAARKKGFSLVKHPWERKLVGISADSFNQQIGKARAYFSGGGVRIYAHGIVNAMNWRAKNKLSLFDESPTGDDTLA